MNNMDVEEHVFLFCFFGRILCIVLVASITTLAYHLEPYIVYAHSPVL